MGFATGNYRHLQSELVLPNLKTKRTSDITKRSTADLGLDPVTHLPAVLSYSTHTDDGAFIPIAIENRYLN